MNKEITFTSSQSQLYIISSLETQGFFNIYHTIAHLKILQINCAFSSYMYRVLFQLFRFKASILIRWVIYSIYLTSKYLERKTPLIAREKKPLI